MWTFYLGDIARFFVCKLSFLLTPPENERMSPEKGPFLKGHFIFQPSIFRGYVSFQNPGINSFSPCKNGSLLGVGGSNLRGDMWSPDVDCPFFLSDSSSCMMCCWRQYLKFVTIPLRNCRILMGPLAPSAGDLEAVESVTYLLVTGYPELQCEV